MVHISAFSQYVSDHSGIVEPITAGEGFADVVLCGEKLKLK